MLYKHIVFDHDGTLVQVIDRKTILFEGMKDLLNILKKRGCKLYVWTARNRHSTIESLKSNGILELFEDISTSSDAQMKPSCEGLKLMLSDFNKSFICVIGDNTSDVLGARAFGVASFGANWNDKSGAKFEYLKSYGADSVFNEVSELKRMLLAKMEK